MGEPEVGRTDREGKDEVAYRMAVYAAQVHCVDYNVGKLLDYLKKNRKLDNTLVMFLSDNGACAEPYAELGGGKVSEINNPACSVFPSYGRAWAQVSNTPFRKYKCRSYEGGISTPLIVSWKSNLKNKKGEWCRVPGYLPDIMPTILEATGVAYPETYHGGNKIYPLVGSSLFPAIQRKQTLSMNICIGNIRTIERSAGETGKQSATKKEKSGNCTMWLKTVPNVTIWQNSTLKCLPS